MVSSYHLFLFSYESFIRGECDDVDDEHEGSDMSFLALKIFNIVLCKVLNQKENQCTTQRMMWRL